jgi:hypothetical protein
MKALAGCLSLLCMFRLGNAQTLLTNGVQRVTISSNLVSISNAVRIASGLRVGVTGADVQRYLREQGTSQTNVYCLSLDRGRTLTYPYSLTGDTTLMLDMHCTEPPSKGLFGWSNPVLDGAYIQKKGTNIISIVLTNVP